MNIRPLLTAVALLALPFSASAHESGHNHGHTPARSDCPADETALRCANAATPVLLPGGNLVLAWSAGGRMMVARSSDGGATLSPPLALNPSRQEIDDNGEARPVVAADGSGRVAVLWSVRHDKAYSGTLMLARSTDGAKSFGPAKAIASDRTSQRFSSAAVDANGRLYLAWIDKRGIGPAKKAGEKYEGAALALAWSDDFGATFAHEAVAEHHSCECCRIAMAFDTAGRPVLLWRHVFAPNVRDHAIMTFTDRDHPGIIRRVADDDWRVDACPHHGPALAVAENGTIHAAWYTDGRNRQGLFYARSAAGGAAFTDPRPVGNPDRVPAHAQLLAVGDTVWLAWKEFDGERTAVMAQSSADGGATWSAPAALATTADASDHPLLVSDGRTASLSWLTRAEGWRLIRLGGSP
jgi:hypothetical protein